MSCRHPSADSSQSASAISPTTVQTVSAPPPSCRVFPTEQKLMGIHGTRSVDSIHKELGHIMWEYVGMARDKEGLELALNKLKDIRKTFEKDLFIPGQVGEGMNIELDKAFRLNDFITMGELIAYDALNRNESCGGHFRTEYQTPEVGNMKAATRKPQNSSRNPSTTRQSRFRHVTTSHKPLKREKSKWKIT